MTMTSVSGHLMGLDFGPHYRKWYSCQPSQLFDLPVEKKCPDNMLPIKRTLEREAKKAQWLIIWTDCDREGENIGFEVIDVCRAVKPSLKIFRATFSEITLPSVTRALENLGQPNLRVSQAVDVRQELDLRIGAAFTRFQTMRLQKKLFDETAAQSYHDVCLENPIAKVEDCKSKPKSKWRPLPMDTVELEKLGARKLKLSAKVVMQAAEKLYTQGFISYPRTETNIFPKELNLRPLVEIQTRDQRWGDFAGGILQHGPNPRPGKKSDQAHPPIHPTKLAANLSGNEARVYELIVRHFLACVSQDALGKETTVNIDINGEKFIAHGLTVVQRNYLEIYIYDKWSDKEIPDYVQIHTFEPSQIDLTPGHTQPPNLLTEADLISLMDKHGIGTDATHAEHIETVKSRDYIGVQDRDKLVPGVIGIALCDGYDAMGFEMSKPNLRAGLEADLKSVCEGGRQPDVVLREQIAKYKSLFQIAAQQVTKIDEACARYLNEVPQNQ
ncbi:hypothetical protein TCAL_06940 [Tigriopus californicus]|uniref:DNA topoisomerase n=1 Tax=Tigriopus californicus TaxID=6832 RepID=A0A553NVF4_TIGCA|nr:hypothetical protein TCAL_06940 [Tigriopus californicus]|eukprot:TCALIF_06940-PA protein Name:"Similar to TOP3A DNA topoisomerase 3-alpha (Homo sapiens)" AED:0.12 eAED:0.15 QI:62/0.16/0.14/1/0.5/0.57/7/95/498